MICSIIIGRKGSTGFKNKNNFLINNKPICWYPMNAAQNSRKINKNFVSTDDLNIQKIAKKLNFKIINRPKYLATSKALGEDVFVHAYKKIKKIYENVNILVLLFCNAPTINYKMIDQGISLLQKNPDADSVVTISKYNMFSPLRARRIDKEGYLKPYIDFKYHPSSNSLNCDRDSQGDVWFADVALSVIRSRNLENIQDGLLPQKWMGKKILPLYNDAGLDIDFEWQVGQLKWWIDKKYE